MKKRLRIAAVILIVAVMTVMLWQILRPREQEPIFQGKTLSEWMATWQGYADTTYAPPAIEAVRQMGTNALPYLMRELRAKDGLFWRKLPRSAYKFKLIFKLRQWCGPSAGVRQSRAVFFLRELGPAAAPAVPALSECLDRPDIAQMAVDVLGYYDSVGHVGLGPEAAPGLLKAVTNGNAQIRWMAANSLGNLKTRPELVVPALIHALKDTVPQVRANAARSFGGYKADATIIVPPLMETLNDTDPNVRAGAAWMLGRFRAQASGAAPKLMSLLKDSDGRVQKEAGDALKLIDPEGAVKAGCSKSGGPAQAGSCRSVYECPMA